MNVTAMCVWRLVFAISTLFDTPQLRNALQYQCNLYIAEKYITFSGLQFHRWQYASICICLAVIAFETRGKSWNSMRIWPYSSSRSSKVIDLGVNGKPICDFILVINCNFSRICYRFRDIFTLKDRKTADFTHPSVVWRLRSGEPLRISGWNLPRKN